MGKAAAIGALTIGGLAFADHAAEVGVHEAAGDLIEGGADMLDGAQDASRPLVDIFDFIDMRESADDAHAAVEQVGGALESVLDSADHWLGDMDALDEIGEVVADAANDFIADLF